MCEKETDSADKFSEWYRKAFAASKVNANADNEGLGFTQIGQCSIGFVDEISGTGAAECPTFVPTHKELLELARYWSRELLHCDTVCFLYGYSGSSEWRLIEYANRRLERIADILGDDNVKAIFTEVENEFRTKWGESAWELYKSGDCEERDRLMFEGNGNIFQSDLSSREMRALEARVNDLIRGDSDVSSPVSPDQGSVDRTTTS
jgi:hypothetical protein